MLQLPASELILWAIALPFIGAVGVALTGRWPNLREGVTLATGSLVAWLAFSIHAALRAGDTGRVVLAEPLPGLPVAFSVEPLGMLFALIASTLW
ncbi:MAG: monovalent cation/H+ antiporter subunit D family protein, partial [Gammaproteobacteria bacterium]|nr:monovalent cation/H+ antiporter subunit D family protein [Gammaproteobacteria bacterium]